MVTYRELKLHEILEDCDLDFACHTYEEDQCSCCYSPSDMKKEYWRNQNVLPEDAEYEYILFKNAYNGSGTVKLDDIIGEYTCVEYRIYSDDKFFKVVEWLRNRLGEFYDVTYSMKDGKINRNVAIVISAKEIV